MRKYIWFWSALSLLAGPAQAGPNANGVLVVHDARLTVSYTISNIPICDQGYMPTLCSEVDVEVDGAQTLSQAAVFKVYAGFPENASPRLMGVTYGINYDASHLYLFAWSRILGQCGDFELADPGWPSPGTGCTITWNSVWQNLLVPIYAFYGYTDGTPLTFDVGPHPTQGGYFGDDTIPAILDPVAGYGKLGFDMPGVLVCPAPAVPGVCCDPQTGGCTLTLPGNCPPPNVWHAEWTSCFPNPCPGLFYVCCDLNGDCTLTLAEDCLFPNVWHAEWTSCLPNPCPELIGVCCAPTGACTLTIPAGCQQPSTWHQGWNTCSPNPCPQLVAVCCVPNGSCAITTMDNCPPSGVWHPEWISCAPNPCPQPSGACCHQDGSCTYVPAAQCDGDWLGYGLDCLPNPCSLPTAACCAPSGHCTLTIQPLCPIPYVWHEEWPSCLPNPCPQPPSGGPNAGGTLIVHDANLLVSATNGAMSLCQQGQEPSDCESADTEVDGAGSLPPGDAAIFKVYAAFPAFISPRLMGVTWGIEYDASSLVLEGREMCGDFELNDADWPAPGAGSTVTWDDPQTDHLVGIYTFAAYTSGNATLFELSPNPSQGGYFGDDTVPSILDPIMGYGRLGFDRPGEVACPGNEPMAACCAPDFTCTVTTEDDCPPPSDWHPEWPNCYPNPCAPVPMPSACCMPIGDCFLVMNPAECQPPNTYHPEWSSCDPNLCPPPGVPVERSTWGRIKYQYR